MNNQFKPSAVKRCYGYIWTQFAVMILCLHASPLTCCIIVGNGIQVCSQQLSCCLCNVLVPPPPTWGPLTYVLICFIFFCLQKIPFTMLTAILIYTLSSRSLQHILRRRPTYAYMKINERSNVFFKAGMLDI